MKKILYVVTKSVMGGAQKAVFDLACNFKDKYEVSVCAGGQDELSEKLRKNNIKYYSLGNLERDMSAKKDSLSFFALLKIIKEVKPDILHLHSPKAGGLGALAGRIYGIKKIIYTAHGWPFNEDRPKYQKILIKFFSYITAILSHKVIVLSEKEKRDANWPFIKNKLEVIPVGLDQFEKLTKEDSIKEIETRAGIDSSRPIVGTIAELHKNKGLEYAIDAVKNINVSYIIVGEGEEREKIENKIRTENIKNVFLAGNIPDAKRILNAFNIFLLPSIKEGLPFTLLEAGLAKIPIIATNVGGIPELIHNEKEGLVVFPKNPINIESAIKIILENQEQSKQWVENLYQKIIEKYNTRNLFFKTNSLY